ncbi:MAG: ABC transporter permease, partial [Actinomycetota bacterium]
MRWLRNPWAKARFLWAIAIAYILWTLLPVVIAVLFSFNGGRSLTAWQGFSTQWYAGNVSSVFDDPELRSALGQSFKLAGLTVLFAVPLGVGFALALDRWRGRGSGTANFVMLFSFITPEIAIGVA